MFVGRSIGHFSYYDSVLAGLLERRAKVSLLLDKKWSARWIRGINRGAIEEFTEKYPTFSHIWLKRRADKWRDFIFDLRELRNFRSYLVRTETTPFYIKRQLAFLSKDWKARARKPLFQRLLRTPLADVLLTLIEKMIPPDKGIVEFIQRKRPDLMICCPMNLRYSEETEYAKAAKQLGIPLAVITISWDNLSTKGMFHIAPDKLFVWNKYQFDDAIRIQHIPADRISVSGAPFFDKWFEPAADLMDRAAFCKVVGLDPARPILLYLGSSKNIAADESWFIRAVKERLEAEGGELGRTQILIRPHPVNADIFAEVVGEDVKVWPEGGALPETREDFAMMRNSFFHAKAALGINTSAMIDTVLAGVPTFSVRIEQYAQTQTDAVHFSYLEDAECLYMAENLDEFVALLADVIDGRDNKASQRRAFSELFARPKGRERPAGDFIAEEALALIPAAAPKT